jgi:hypothetical protein
MLGVLVSCRDREPTSPVHANRPSRSLASDATVSTGSYSDGAINFVVAVSSTDAIQLAPFADGCGNYKITIAQDASLPQGASVVTPGVAHQGLTLTWNGGLTNGQASGLLMQWLNDNDPALVLEQFGTSGDDYMVYHPYVVISLSPTQLSCVPTTNLETVAGAFSDFAINFNARLFATDPTQLAAFSDGSGNYEITIMRDPQLAANSYLITPGVAGAGLAFAWNGDFANYTVTDLLYRWLVENDPNLVVQELRTSGSDWLSNHPNIVIPLSRTKRVVTPTAGPHGELTPGTPQFVAAGEPTVFTVTPASGYRIDAVTGCGGTLVGNTYTTGPVSTDCTVVAAFAFLDETPPIVFATVTGTPGESGWYVSDVMITWSTTDAESDIASLNGCSSAAITADTPGATFTCEATNAAGLTTTRSVTVTRDATLPVVAYAGNAGTYSIDQTVALTCSATDAGSGIVSTTCRNISAPAYTFGVGSHTFSASARDAAGNVGSASTSFSIRVSASGLCTLTTRLVSKASVASSLCAKLRAAEACLRRGNQTAKDGQIGAYIHELDAQAGKVLSRKDAALLISFARLL